MAATTDRPQGDASPLSTARSYLGRGWAPIPVPYRSKKPTLPRWQQLRVTEAMVETYFTVPRVNVGVLLGAPSGGLADVDIDCGEGLALGPMFLSPTASRFGRASRRASHWLYIATSPIKTQRFQDPLRPEAEAMLVELRFTGSQTLFPGSVHPSGEVVIWDAEGDPTATSGEELRVRAALLASASLLARYWPGSDSHVRHVLALALAGWLLRGALSASDVRKVIVEATRLAGDDEVEARGRNVDDTARNLADGRDITGYPTAATILDPRLLDAVGGWLRLDGRAKIAAEVEHRHHQQLGELRASWRPSIVRLSDVRRERVEWLWPGRVPLGKLTVFDGDPGLGKSLMTLDLAARVSTNREMPDGTKGDLSGRAGVVLLSAEDGLGDTIAPRLHAAGADSASIVALSALTDDDGRERLPTLTDLTAIEEAIGEVQARLVIIDPVMAYLGGDTNAHRDQDVRRALAPLAALAERTGAAVLVVRHLNKSSGGNALYRGGGSIGIIGAARSGLLVAKDPDDETGTRRVLAVSKSNLSAPVPSLLYQVEDADGVARIDWLGTSEHTAASVLSVPDDPTDRSAVQEAQAILRELLAPGPLRADDVKKAARGAGIAPRTLDRAKNALGVKSDKVGFGVGAEWLWVLPAHADGASAVNDTSKIANSGEGRQTLHGGDLHPAWRSSEQTARTNGRDAPCRVAQCDDGGVDGFCAFHAGTWGAAFAGAREREWSPIRLGTGETIGGTEAAWETYVATAGVGRVAAALALLEHPWLAERVA